MNYIIKSVGKTENRGGGNRIVNSNPFILGDEKSDYFLGLLGSDGCISTRRLSSGNIVYSIHIQLKDLDLIEKYRVFISEKLTLHKRKNKAGSLMGTVLFQNKEVSEFLISLGIIPKKSKIFKYLLPLNGNILRGHFDGDGSVSQNRPKITTGSPYFRDQLEEYFRSIGIEFTTTVKDKKFNNCWDITVLYNSRKAFFDLMYENSTVFLQRKYNKYCACLP